MKHIANDTNSEEETQPWQKLQRQKNIICQSHKIRKEESML